MTETATENSTMSQISIYGELEKMTAGNFANRLLFKLCGLKDVIADPALQHWFDEAHPQIREALEETAQTGKASSKLAYWANNGSYRPEDYFMLVEEGKKGSSAELREFLTLTDNHTPPLRMIDHLSLWVVASMTTHLPPQERVELILLKPDLLQDTYDMAFNAVSENGRPLIADEERALILARVSPADAEQIGKNRKRQGEYTVHFTGLTPDGKMMGGVFDTRILPAQARWSGILRAREAAKSGREPECVSTAARLVVPAAEHCRC